ncbi:MAG: gamma-glutamyltransferase [Myxococcales bacterium]|nr:gamma-glutamyltransferase [Myxococcales bacterium]
MTADLHGCVAAGHPVTAHAAHEVLRAGGNAFDAALAAVAAACVAESVLASPGGGGFLLARPAQGPARIYDFFVQTPRVRRPAEESSAHPIVTDWGTTQQEFQIGPGTAATPGLVRGLFAVHAALGRMPMPQILAPAVLAAREGVVVTPFQAYLMTLVAPIYLGEPDARALFGNPEGGSLNRGDRMHNPDLGALFEQLGRDGERLFHEGEVAAAIVKQCRDQGGHITRDDLVHYRVRVREPLTLRYRDATIITNPPPSAGGSLIAFGLGLLGRVPLQGLGFASPEHLALLARVLARTVDARAAHSNLEHLLAAAVLDEHGAALLHELAAARAAHRGTTHISVIDRDGNAASVTLSNGEGCGSLIPGTGVMLNNMLGEDDVNPAGPHAWPLDVRLSSMMSPTAIVRDDGWFAVTGSGGSKRIRSAILQVVSNLIDFAMPLREAIGAQRMHADAGQLNLEGGFADGTEAAMTPLFPRVIAWQGRNMYFGGCHTVARAPDGSLDGAGDPRRDGVCLGAAPT